MAAVQPTTPLNAARFSTTSDDVFGRIASRYDLLCDLFSFGIHRYWKRRIAMQIARESWTELLDAASGTGDIVLRVLSRQDTRNSRHIVASDISPEMLSIAGRRLSRLSQAVELRRLDAHSMPSIPDNSVDVFSISLGLKICDRLVVLREALRVLKPREIRDLGFDEVGFERLSLGIVAIHVARKPKS
jgi:ubiquinone/menaquinone biosynthesis C-methylase UbiE